MLPLHVAASNWRRMKCPRPLRLCSWPPGRELGVLSTPCPPRPMASTPGVAMATCKDGDTRSHSADRITRSGRGSGQSRRHLHATAAGGAVDPDTPGWRPLPPPLLPPHLFPEMQTAKEDDKAGRVTFSVCSFKCSPSLTHRGVTHTQGLRAGERSGANWEREQHAEGRIGRLAAAALPRGSFAAWFALCLVPPAKN